jgi:hypothetical protein
VSFRKKWALIFNEMRVKYVLGESVSGRTDIDVTMKQAESGLNLADYLEKKEKPPATGEGK